jgi:hypothetical protein
LQTWLSQARQGGRLRNSPGRDIGHLPEGMGDLVKAAPDESPRFGIAGARESARRGPAGACRIGIAFRRTMVDTVPRSADGGRYG